VRGDRFAALVAKPFILILSGFCGLRGTTGARWPQALVLWGTYKIYGSAEGVALTVMVYI